MTIKPKQLILQILIKTAILNTYNSYTLVSVGGFATNSSTLSMLSYTKPTKITVDKSKFECYLNILTSYYVKCQFLLAGEIFPTLKLKLTAIPSLPPIVTSQMFVRIFSVLTKKIEKKAHHICVRIFSVLTEK
jgi:hypothetical protein